MFVFFTPMLMLPETLGDAEGMTAGRGIEGLGETDLRTDWPICEPNEERLLCVVGGGFIGNARDCGVPGAEGAGDPVACEVTSCTKEALWLAAACAKSGGAGLFEEIRRPGRSILVTLLCWSSENAPSLVLSVYM